MPTSTFDFSQLRAPFRYREFRALFWAELIYRSGIFMSFAAIALALKNAVGDEPIYFGMLGAALTLPSLIISPLAGTIVGPTRRIFVLRYVQVMFALIYILCAAMLYNNYIGYLMFLWASLLFGVGLAISSPVLTAYLQDIISNADDLASANSIALSTLSIVQFTGSFAGGIIIFYLGISSCFVVAALTSIIAFFILKRPLQITTKEVLSKETIKGVKIGFAYLISNRALFVIIGLEALSAFAAFPYVFQLPLLNSYVLSGSSFTFTLLLSAGALGGTAGGIILGLRRSYDLPKTILIAGFLMGASLLLLSFSSIMWVSLFSIFILNAAMSMLTIAELTFIQSHTDDDKKGTVLGIFMMAHVGLIPFGSFFFYGWFGKLLGGIQILGVAGTLFLLVFAGCAWMNRKTSFLEPNKARLF